MRLPLAGEWVPLEFPPEARKISKLALYRFKIALNSGLVYTRIRVLHRPKLPKNTCIAKLWTLNILTS